MSSASLRVLALLAALACGSGPGLAAERESKSPLAEREPSVSPGLGEAQERQEGAGARLGKSLRDELEILGEQFADTAERAERELTSERGVLDRLYSDLARSLERFADSGEAIWQESRQRLTEALDRLLARVERPDGPAGEPVRPGLEET